MKVKQFFDEGLAHGSYAVISSGKMAVIDPARDIQPYEAFADANDAEIVAVFETHPHADFASSHMEFHEKHGARIYVNPKMKVDYPHEGLEDGDGVKMGDVTFRALFTPGHSPDHNSYLLLDEQGQPHSVFTGDSLFVGDVGRPDLREEAGNIQAQRKELAQQMYSTIKNVFRNLPDEVMVYPAHGKGSLCGKNMSDETYSTIGKEKERNWAMKEEDENTFVDGLLEGQPYIPKYFPYDVSINASGVKSLEESIKQVPIMDEHDDLEPGVMILDTRPAEQFRKGHMKGAINLPDGSKFETWLGSLVDPQEKFYLIAGDEKALQDVIYKAAKIGYEALIKGAKILEQDFAEGQIELADPDEIKTNDENHTILDVRNNSEVEAEKIFENSLNIPLHELREAYDQIPRDKPVAVHCAGGYRSAIAASILKSKLNELEVKDISEGIKSLKEEKAKAQ